MTGPQLAAAQWPLLWRDRLVGQRADRFGHRCGLRLGAVGRGSRAQRYGRLAPVPADRDIAAAARLVVPVQGDNDLVGGGVERRVERRTGPDDALDHALETWHVQISSDPV